MSKSMFVLAVLLFPSGCLGQTAADTPPAKSARTAVRASLLATVIPVVAGGVIFFGFSDQFDNWDDAESIIAASVGGAGVIFGPGVGHCYAGNCGHMATGAVIRSALLGTIPLGVAMGSAMSGDEHVGPGIILFIAPAVYSAVHDIATLDRVVARYNRRHGLGEFTLHPSLVVDHETVRAGIALSWQL